MKQHRKPCATCPFTDKCEPGELGGSPAEVYVGQTYMPYWIPCHERIDYDNPNWKHEYQTPQCVGHSIMRSNVDVIEMMPDPLLHVDPFEGDRVFKDMTYFFAYHLQVSLGEATKYVRSRMEELIKGELHREGAEFIEPSKIKAPE